MGIYLFIVGLEDLRFENRYKDEAGSWMTSWSCTFLGMLAMTSSEVNKFSLNFSKKFFDSYIFEMNKLFNLTTKLIISSFKRHELHVNTCMIFQTGISPDLDVHINGTLHADLGTSQR